MTTDALVSNHNPPVWGLRGTLIWGLIIAVAFVVTQVVVMGLYIGIHYKDAPSSEYESLMLGLQYNGTVVSLVALASLLVCGPLIWGIVKLKKNSNLKHYLGLKRVEVKTLARLGRRMNPNSNLYKKHKNLKIDCNVNIEIELMYMNKISVGVCILTLQAFKSYDLLIKNNFLYGCFNI